LARKRKSAAGRPSQAQTEILGTGNMRILWVENHAVFARLAGRQFLSAHEVVVVDSLTAAHKALVEQSFDAVILDYDLDDGKGTELFGSIQLQLPRPVVIAASAHDAGNEALRLAGADAVCGKLRFSEIEAVLLRAAGSKRSE
jgi:DNA-binding response OmpR family regulator